LRSQPIFFRYFLAVHTRDEPKGFWEQTKIHRSTAAVWLSPTIDHSNGEMGMHVTPFQDMSHQQNSFALSLYEVW